MKSLRKLVPAFSLLLVSAVILSSASFAWFTMSRQVTAQGMNVTVTAPNNLLIAGASDPNPSDWKELKQLSATGTTLIPASSVSGANDSFYVLENNSVADSASGKLTTDSNLRAANATETNNESDTLAYYDFKYKMKTEGGQEVKVALSELTIATNSDTTIQPVRVAILYGANENPTILASITNNSVFNGTDTYYQTDGMARNAAKATNSNAAAAGEVKLATVDATKQLFTVPASGEPEYVTIRVWFEGEDEMCTMKEAAGCEFELTAKFDAID